MKKLLYILIFSFPFVSTGQNWSPTGATWHYGFSVWTTEGYYKIEYLGDTTISSIPCKKLLKTLYWHDLASLTSDTVEIGTEYTYSDNDKVYIFKHNQFYTLYNFAAHSGDSWTVPEMKHYIGCDTIGSIRVDSTGTMKIDGQTLRYICVSIADTSPKWGWNAKIVERIGPIKSYYPGIYDYLFPIKLNYCGMLPDELVEGGNFRCYSDISLKYMADISPTCDYFTSINSHDKKVTSLSIFPNPSKGSFTAYFDQKVKEIILADLVGNILLQQTTNKQTRFDFVNVKSGTYILTVTDKDNRTITRKIISCP